MKMWFDIALAACVIAGAFIYLADKAVSYKALAEAEREARENAETETEQQFKRLIDTERELKETVNILVGQNDKLSRQTIEIERLNGLLKKTAV